MSDAGLWLEDGPVRVHQLALGCITRDWQVAGASVVLGYADPAAYADNPHALGAVVGRVASRIRNARFTLAGTRYELAANEGPHMLHGGPEGLSRRIWSLDRDGPRAAILRCTSPDGDQGFPGRLDVEVRVTLEGYRVTWEMTATPDRPTPVSLAQHNYYALGGEARAMTLRLPATGHTPTDAANLPTGIVAPLDARTDFRDFRRIGAAMDRNFALPRAPRIEAAGTTHRVLLETDQPGLQVYTAQGLAKLHDPLPGQRHQPFAGLCLEPQGWPDAVNQPGFPSIIATPDRPYRQRTSVTILPLDA